MVLIDYFNPFHQGFDFAKDDFHDLKGWQQAAAIIAGIVGGILTPFFLFTGSVAAFRWSVEKFTSYNDSKFSFAVVGDKSSSSPSFKSGSIVVEPGSPLIQIDHSSPPKKDEVCLNSGQFRKLLSKGKIKSGQKITITDHLRIDGEDPLFSLPEFASLPKDLDLTIEGFLYISNFPKLTSFPKRLKVRDCMEVVNCSNLSSFPKNLHVGQKVIIEKCPKLNRKNVPKEVEFLH